VSDIGWEVLFRSFDPQELRRDYAEHKREQEMDECPHDEHDHGICLDCGKDIMDDLVGAAEMARDALDDR
jgi:hypothetical protein